MRDAGCCWVNATVCMLQVVVKCCQLIRTVVSDDDVRVEFGRAHEYACMIAEQENGLELLTSLLSGEVKIKILKEKTWVVDVPNFIARVFY